VYRVCDIVCTLVVGEVWDLCEELTQPSKTRLVELGVDVPLMVPTSSGCEGLTIEQYKNGVDAVWEGLQRVVAQHGVLESLLDVPLVFQRCSPTIGEEWYNLELSVRSVSRVLDERAWVDELVVVCGVALACAASFHARREDGSLKFTCIPIATLDTYKQFKDGGRPKLPRITESLVDRLHEVDGLFVPIPLPNHFTLMYCDIKRKSMLYFDTLCDDVYDPKVEKACDVYKGIIVAMLDQYKVALPIHDWDVRVVSKVVEVNTIGPRPTKWDLITCPDQTDAYNCGMYVIAITECIVSGESPGFANRYDMDKYRKHLMWVFTMWHRHKVWPGFMSSWCEHL
jgi:Ulp1 protease family, C-terminal catalytic domain